MVHASVFQHTSSYFTSYCGKPLSPDYRVYINGREAAVYSCRISAYPFNRVWPGFQRPVDQTEPASFVNLVSDEAVTVEVEPLTKSVDGTVRIKPYSKGISAERVGNRIRFTLTEAGGYVFQIDDYHGLLYLFNNKPVPCEDPTAVTYYFGKGVHFPGKITLKSNESIYLDKDAYVYGCVFAENAENLRIYGNGILDDSTEERICEECFDSLANGNLKFYDCKNIRLEGFGITNSAVWCVNLFHCFDVTADGINVFGQWRYNTDGIDIVNCQRITIKNSFVHSFDDTVVIKGIDRYSFENNRDILTENCILWCDWGKTCELGLETAAREYDNIVFRDCDILRGGNTVCDIQNGDCAEIHNVLFENLRIEHERAYTPEVYQRTDDLTYTKQNEVGIARILSIHNARFREAYAHLNLPELKSEIPLGDKRFAGVHDVTVRDIRIYCDNDFAAEFGPACAEVRIKNLIPTSEFRDITVENVSINGKKLSEKDFSIRLESADDTCLTVK